MRRRKDREHLNATTDVIAHGVSDDPIFLERGYHAAHTENNRKKCVWIVGYRGGSKLNVDLP